MEMTVSICRQKVFARHGVLPQERAVGADFLVSIEAVAEVSPDAYLDDRLEGTVNYARISGIVTREMLIPSKLLEHVAKRISDAILAEFPRIRSVSVRVEKENPPLGIQCGGVAVQLTRQR